MIGQDRCRNRREQGHRACHHQGTGGRGRLRRGRITQPRARTRRARGGWETDPFVSADLSQLDGADDLIAAAADRGGIDVLVNNVGAVTVHPRGFATVTDDEWQASWDLNVMGMVRPTGPPCHRCTAVMADRSSSSDPSMRTSPTPGFLRLCATKAAVTNFAKALSKELGPKNIRVNSVSPGPVTTGMWLDEGGVADTIAGASGQAAEEVRAATAGAAHRPVHNPGTGCRPGRVPGQRPVWQHHRIRPEARRRLDHHHLK